MMGADSFLPSELLKLKWKAGRFGVVVLCCSIGRTGSRANVRAESLGIACAVFCVIALIGFFVIACTGSLAMACTGSLASACIGSFVIALIDFFVVARTGSFAIACAGSFVIACAISFLVSCSGLVRFNVEGASACAYTVALEMTKSDVVANVKQIGTRTEVRYAGNRGVRQALFFLFLKTGAQRPGPSLMPLWTSRANCEFLIPLREIPCLPESIRVQWPRDLYESRRSSVCGLASCISLLSRSRGDFLGDAGAEDSAHPACRCRLAGVDLGRRSKTGEEFAAEFPHD